MAGERTVADILEEGIDLLRIAFDDQQHPPVGKIGHLAADVKSRRDMADGRTEANALNAAFVMDSFCCLHVRVNLGNARQDFIRFPAMSTANLHRRKFDRARLIPESCCVMRISLALVGAALLSTLPAEADYPDPDKKPKAARNFDIIQYFPQKGREVSFGGDALKWKGKGECSQKESQEPIIEVQGEGVKVRNAMILGSPDGIHVTAKNVIIEDITFPDVCEDGITANDADNLIIRNCYFRGAEDKAIQLNSGKNIVIENCVFEDCSTPIRIKSGVTATIRNNKVRKARYFVLADGDGKATVESNEIRDSDTAVRVKQDAVINANGNDLSGVKKPWIEQDNGRINR